MPLVAASNRSSYLGGRGEGVHLIPLGPPVAARPGRCECFRTPVSAGHRTIRRSLGDSGRTGATPKLGRQTAGLPFTTLKGQGQRMRRLLKAERAASALQMPDRRSLAFCRRLTIVATLATGFLVSWMILAASAETYAVPLVAAVGTDGSDAQSQDSYVLAVSQGGCAEGAVAVVVGDGNRSCTQPHWWWWLPEHDAEGYLVTIGLFGADSGGAGIVVSDTGDAHGCQTYLLDGCDNVSVAASGTGTAVARELAVSGTGPASSGTVGASGTGTANGSYSVSGTGHASRRYDDINFLAVSGTGAATSGGCDLWGIAVAGGDASGCHAVSGVGRAEGGAVALAGGDATAYHDCLGVVVTCVNVYGTAVSGTGNAQGSSIAVAPAGQANGGLVAVGGNDAYGGLVAVSATGDACGASIYGAAPLGGPC